MRVVTGHAAPVCHHGDNHCTVQQSPLTKLVLTQIIFYFLAQNSLNVVWRPGSGARTRLAVAGRRCGNKG